MGNSAQGLRLPAVRVGLADNQDRLYNLGMSSKNTPKTETLADRGLRTFRTYQDGSGVDCLIDVYDHGSHSSFTFAANILGTPRLHLTNYKNGCYAGSKRAYAKAVALFAEAIATMTTPEWRALNTAMYADLATAGGAL
jgi:hypothetical protein